MSLKDTIQTDIKQAMLSGNKNRLKVLRILSAAIKQKEVDERIILDEAQILTVLDKMLKQRRDSLMQYQDANRNDLAEIEAFEIQVLSEFMPQALSDDEIEQLISDAIIDTNAQGMQDMGKVMSMIKSKAQGRADMGKVSQIVKEHISA